MFSATPANYKVGGPFQAAATAGNQEPHRQERVLNAWANQAETPRADRSSMMDLHASDLQTPIRQRTHSAAVAAPSTVGDETAAAIGNSLPGGYDPTTTAMEDVNATEDDRYLPTFLLGVGTGLPMEQYAAPLEPDTSLMVDDLTPRKRGGIPYHGVPLHAYNADDDLPPQSSLLELMEEDRPPLMTGMLPTTTIDGRSADHSFTASMLNGSVRSDTTLGHSQLYGSMTKRTADLNEAELREDTPTTITVFGFPASALSAILARFRDFGDIVNYQSPPQASNYCTLTYRTRTQAQRALAVNGTHIDGYIIGVTESTSDETTLQQSQRPQQPPAPSLPAPSSDINIRSARLQSATLSSALAAPVRVPSNRKSYLQQVCDYAFGW